jgi:hypothetical protein
MIRRIKMRAIALSCVIEPSEISIAQPTQGSKNQHKARKNRTGNCHLLARSEPSEWRPDHPK